MHGNMNVNKNKSISIVIIGAVVVESLFKKISRLL